jgi:transposase
LDTQQQIGKLEAALAAKDMQIAAQREQITVLQEQVAILTKQVELLTEKLGQYSGNSSKPPSSDRPSDKHRSPKKKDKKSGRKRGGQPGHKGHQRDLIPSCEVDKMVDVYPGQCENCWQTLAPIFDPDAKRHQVTEVPPITPHTTEYRRHQIQCVSCGHHTRPTPEDERIPPSAFGPRLCSIVALLTGVYHVSRRQAQKLVWDLLGVQMSLGALSGIESRVSNAVTPAVHQAWAHVKNAKVKHTDGTGWFLSNIPIQLWTIATAMATVYKIVMDGSKATLQPLFGQLKGILVSDRAKALTFWAMERRQICFAHLIRKFVSFSERDGPAGNMGRQLLDYTGILFAYWKDYKSGNLPRDALLHRTAPLREQFESLLETAAAARIARVSGACADILAHRTALWTFLERHDVPPTNNHAEQELRKFVLWRKRCFGSQSQRGNLFAENMMTVAHTARKQKLDLLPWLTNCCIADANQTQPPSLFSAA